MRATRAYIAGFGTAGSLLAGAAVLFILASAVVAFRGWPSIASQSTPPSLSLDATPLPHSPVYRRLRAVGVIPAPTAVSLRRAAGRTRAAGAAGGSAAPIVGRSGSQPASGTPGGGAGGTGGSGNGGGSGSGGGSGGGTNPGGGGTAGGGTGTGGGQGGGGITVRTPTKPPITVTLPTGGAGTIIKRVTGSAGGTVSTLGNTLGGALGGH